MQNALHWKIAHCTPEGGGVSGIGLNERPPLHIVPETGRKVVISHRLKSGGAQRLARMRTDESGAASNEKHGEIGKVRLAAGSSPSLPSNCFHAHAIRHPHPPYPAFRIPHHFLAIPARVC